MNAYGKLLTSVSVVSVICRNVCLITAHQTESKVLHMTEAPIKSLLLRHIRSNSSLPGEASIELLQPSIYESIGNLTVESLDSADKCHKMNDTTMSSRQVVDVENPRMTPNDTRVFNGGFHSFNGTASGNASTTTTGFDDDDIVYIESGNLNNSTSNTYRSTNSSSERKYYADMQRYRSIRQWKNLTQGQVTIDPNNSFVLKLLSFNILAQNLLETHRYLYRDHDPRALPWTVRKPLLLQEILGAEANVICLQEVQMDHLSEILVPFKELGYNYLYKKRSNDKPDGLLLLYRAEQFVLVDYLEVEYHQPFVEILNRDNVGLIAKLALRDSPSTQFIIATTHLLYNPKRNDVRLAQLQILMSEIERIAFVAQTPAGAVYLPILLAGDFNLTPHSGVYNFVTKGHLEYGGKGRNLEVCDRNFLTNSLIPPRFFVTDNCQHFNVLVKRLTGEGDGEVMLGTKQLRQTNSTSNYNGGKPCLRHKVNVDTLEYQSIAITEDCVARFSSGVLTHPFNLSSLYEHVNYNGNQEATTHQERWITVDYMFFSKFVPFEKYTLPIISECNTLPSIPNFAIGSDHLCLGASFLLDKVK